MQVPGYETCIVPATGTVTVEVEGLTFDKLGNRGEDVWDGEPEGVYVPVGAKVTIICTSDETETFIAGARYDEVLEPFDVRVDGSILSNTARTTPRPTARSSISSAKNSTTRWDVCWSANFSPWARAAGRAFPAHKHDTDRLPHETRHDETYNFRFRPKHGSVFRSFSAKRVFPATPIT